MEPIFSLGITFLWDELSHMPTGGVWWLDVGRRDDAITLINQTISKQKEQDNIAVITMGEKPKKIIKLDALHGPKKIDLFSMPNSYNGLNCMPQDLMCSVNPKNYLFILLSSDNVWENIPSASLLRWIHSIGRWTKRHNCSLLFVNVGNNIDKQFSLLINEHRSLSGLASLRAQTDIHRYDVAFWCNEKGVTADQQLDVQWHKQSWQVVENVENTPQPRSDEKRVMSHIAVLEGAPALSENWQLFENNEQLFVAARSAQAATIIFSLTQNSQINSIARQIHALRRQRGSALKLIVRENHASLRATDERLMLGCGATLIIPWNAPLSRCLTMIESIQGVKFTRHVPEEIGVLIDQMQPLKLRGYQPWETFCNGIAALMNNSLLPQDGKGVMVALRPVPGLRVEQALTLCRPNRMGDIVTLGENRLVLFLSFCRINDLDTALNHIFPLPVNDIFTNRMVWYEDGQIAAEVLQMQAMRPEKWAKPLAATLNQNAVPQVSREGHGWRRQPTAITLLDDTAGEQTS